jgi:hypothetical protein
MRRPPSIEALVPAYLPEVPRDAGAKGNQPLRYLVIKGGLPDGANRPLVYSAGANGVFDTRGPQSVPSDPFYGWTRAAPTSGATSPAGPHPPPPSPHSRTARNSTQ